MDNYDHEILCPDNKGIRSYLWYDYFHDSKIYNIAFNHMKGIVVLTLECCRDIDIIWDKLSGDRESRRAYINEHKDRFTYVLIFKGCIYFHAERLVMVNDYINGRFKDTALLRKLVSESKRPLYHFRIQTDDGYIDIIFSDFIIRKGTGRVKYPIEEITYQTCKSITDEDKKAALDGDDFERFLAMRELHRANHPELLAIARKNLRLDCKDEDACLYSAHLLGKLGDITDIPNLLDLYLNVETHLISKSICRCSSLLPRRNILDAIELIQLRQSF